MRRLSDGFIFNKSEKKLHFLDNVAKINLTTERIRPEVFEDELKTINRRFNFSLKTKVIDAFVKGDIITIYPALNNLSKLVPIYLTLNPETRRPCAVINIRLYGSMDKNGNINIDIRRLYAFLELAYINLNIYLQPNKFLMNSKINLLSAQIYTKLFNKILDKQFGINFNPLVSDQVNFTLAKFFLLYVLEKQENDITDNIAYNCIFNESSKNSILSVNNDFDPVWYQSFDGFIGGLAESFDMLSKIDIGGILSNFMTMYGEPAVYSLEYYPTLLESIFHSIIFGSRIYRDQMFDSVVGKETNQFHVEVSRLLL